MKSVLFAGLCLTAITATTTADNDAPNGVYQVGLSKVDVTPDYPIRLNGFGNRRDESVGVSQPIFARGMAISTSPDAPPLVLLTIDSLGVRIGMVDEVARRLKESHGIPRENVALTFTHSHCTPKVNGSCDNIFSTPIPPEHQQHIDDYTQELTDLLTKTAEQAIEARSPARLEWGVGNVGFAKNRRTPGGPVDHSLPLLVVKDADSDAIRALYVTYACHAVVLSFNHLSGDWPGYAAEMIERQHPGAVALVSIGCGSDSNPESGVVNDKVDVAEGYGLQIATEVQRLLDGELRPVSGPISTTLNRIDLPLNDLPTREQFTEMTERTDQFAYNARTQLARLDRGESLLAEIDYPIQTWSFGDSLCMVFLAGEVCVDYSLRLKSELDAGRLWLNAYSNDFCSYIPSERLAKEGRYGGGSETPYFALPTTLKAGLEQLIVDEVHQQVPDQFEAAEGTNGNPPKSPKDSLNCLRTHDDLKVELVAAEPLVSDPVAIDFGPDGRLWVAEMNDYGHGVYERFPQTSRVRWLKDVDGDGRFDEGHTFVEGLRFPTDVKVWRDGVLICDAPNILFARDTDGDGTADVTETLFTGFSIINAQALVNSLRFGLDNWVYGAGGIFGGQITSHKTNQTVDVGMRDFRMDPDTGVIEAATGTTQQGRDRNDWGDWFGCSNGSLLMSYPTVAHYAQRNPYVAPPSSVAYIADADAYRLFPPEDLVTFELSGAPGTPTAACGLGIYRDSRLGAEYLGNAFTCEPVHQLVHRIVLEPNGAWYHGHRAENEADGEFLTSTDNWFRPVQARTGPDGALWVVDMYRYVIEHSRWIPQDALEGLDVYAGQGRGRIYRILPRAEPSPPLPRLDQLSPAELVQQLDSSNGPVRDLAQQMLIWHSNDAAELVPLVQQFATTAKTPLGRIHALNTLQRLGGLTDELLLSGLQSQNAEVVKQSVRLAEPRLDQSSELLNRVIALAGDDSPRVRQQVAWSLGETTDPRGADVLAKLAGAGEPEVAVRAAVLSSINAGNVNGVFAAYRKLSADQQDAALFNQLVTLAIQIGEAAQVADVLATVAPSEDTGDSSSFNPATLAAALDAADRRSRQEAVTLPPELTERLRQPLATAVGLLADAGSDEADVDRAFTLLGRSAGPVTQQVLAGNGNAGKLMEQATTAMADFVSPRFSTERQQQAVAALAQTGGEEVGDLLLERLPGVGAVTHDQILDVLLSREEWTHALLDRAAAGDVRLAGLSTDRQQRLLTHRDESIRSQASELLQTSGSSSRAEVVAAYEPALSQTADVEHGREVFRKRCSTCHRLEEFGTTVGPDLQGLTNRDPKWLLNTILDPNKEVDTRYAAWTAVTDDGRTATGLMVEESATSIRLREAEAKEHVLLRNEIEQLLSSGRSLMPEGLERDMSPQDVADVIAYVAGMTKPSAAALAAAAEAPIPKYPPGLAPYLLDEKVPTERKQQAIDQRPGMGAAIIGLMTADLPPGDVDEEYRRIPSIWRVALAVGKRNDGGEMGDLLNVALPAEGKPLRDWQAVVIGGGLINGLTQAGHWPDERLAEVLASAPSVADRWSRTLALSAEMADNAQVKQGTRYDALRMIALRDWAEAGPQLLRYLDESMPDELQMGAVSGLCDVRSPEVVEPLIAAIPRLSAVNRQLAVAGLVRTPERANALLDALAAGRIDRSLVDEELFRRHTDPAIRERAAEVLK